MVNNEIFISGADIKKLYCRHKKWLKRCVLAVTLFAALYALRRPPCYLAEASFKQGGSKPSIGFSMPSLHLLDGFMGLSGESNTSSLMRSRSLVAEVVEKLGLQIERVPFSRIARFFSQGVQNITLFAGTELEEPSRFNFENVSYKKEKAALFYLQFHSEDAFTLLNAKKKVLAQGRCGEPLQVETLSFTLVSPADSITCGTLYSFQIAPLFTVVDHYLKISKVEPKKGSPELLELSCLHQNRQIACSFLNQLMGSYQNYLRRNYYRVAEEQEAYLEKRLEEMGAGLERSLENQSLFMQEQLRKTGFLQTSDRTKVLTESNRRYSQKADNYGLDLHHYDPVAVEQISDCEEKLFSLEVDQGREKLSIQKQLQETSLQLQAVREALISLQKEELDFQSLKQLDHPTAEIKELFKEYTTHLVSQTLGKERGKELQILSDELVRHLSQMLPLLTEQEKTLQETLRSGSLVSNEFQGIPLELAQKLFLDYQGQLDGLQVGVKQLLFVKSQVENPDVDLSSLGTLPSDPITQQMVQKAAELQMQLQDDQNRTSKEQGRLQDALTAQKKFLSFHLGQTAELQRLHLKLVEQKIGGLKQMSQGLIKNEKEVIEERLRELRKRLSLIPDNWLKESQIKLQSDLSRGKFEGLAQLLESKKLEKLLFQVGATPLDMAFAPLFPKTNYFIVYPVVAALLSFFILFGALFLMRLFRGFPLSIEALTAAGFSQYAELSSRVEGSFLELKRGDLEALRYISRKISKECTILTLLNQFHPNCSANLAEILAAQGEKVILVPCFFDQIPLSNEQKGFWHYLQGEIEELPIQQLGSYDFLPCSGRTRLGVELMMSRGFTQMLQFLKESYTRIILLTPAELNSQETYHFTTFSDQILVAMREESLIDLRIFQASIHPKNSSSLMVLLYES